MDDAAIGYASYWKRMSMKIGLSQAAKALGDVRAAQLSAFEQGKQHDLTAEQVQAYLDYLERRIIETPPIIEEE